MKCPGCGLVKNTKVLETRDQLWITMRVLKSKSCQYVFKTYEAIETTFYKEQKRSFIRWTPGEERTLVKLYEEGIPKHEIGEKLGRTATSIYRKIQRLIKTGEYFTILDELKRKADGEKIETRNYTKSY